jgi:beta-xylosidase
VSDTKLHPQEESGDVLLATGGLYAPTIRHHNGVTYIVCTNIIHSDTTEPDISQNFILSTNNLWSNEWSDPVYFEFQGIDPSLFFDDDGRAYIQGSAAPGPMTKIHQFEIDLQTGKKLSEERKIWDGTGGIYPEGPHLYKNDGWYYLLISEGGTHENHMITGARSKNLWGPYHAFDANPLLTASGTNNYIQYTGHCDIFQGKQGEWWGVCLGVRKDQGGRFPMGRETFLLSATWSAGGWPSLHNPTSDLVLPDGTALITAKDSMALTATPTMDYVYIRDPDLRKHQISSDGKTITLTAGKGDLSECSIPTTFIGKRQRHLYGESMVTIHNRLTSKTDSLITGLALYKDELRFARVYYDFAESTMVFEQRNAAKSIFVMSKRVFELKDTVALRIQYTESMYQFSIGDVQTSTEWNEIGSFDSLDMTGPDFVGPVIGIFAVSSVEDILVTFNNLHVD